MAYPPPGYQPPHGSRPAYPPPHGSPPAYPPPHGYHRPAYPPPQNPYPPQYQQPQYQQPQPKRPSPPPKRRKANPLLTAIIFVVLVGLVGGYTVMAMNAPKPVKGDCLASMDGTFFGGMEVVDCSSADARYEVVAYTTSGRSSEVEETICDGYQDGESYVQTRKRQRLSWAICAVPIS